jgi:hypothetical protein
MMDALSRGVTWSLPGGDPPGAVPEPLEGGAGISSAWLRLEGSQVAAVGARLRAAREETLLGLETGELVEILGRVGERFLEEGDPLRIEALEGLPRWSGISPEMALAVVDGMARDWTRRSLRRLVESDFPDPEVLHRFVPGGRPHSRPRALGDPLLVLVVSGSVPGVSGTALLRGLLVRSATVVKPGRGDLLLPLLLAAGIQEEHPGVSRALMVHYWPGGDESARGVEQGWLSEADRVVVYGGGEAVEAVRRGSREGAPVVVYPQRLSLGMVGRERMGPEGGALLRDAARALSLFDGRGCVTPQLLFVEEGGEWTGEEWARRLAVELQEMAHELPPGKLTPGEGGGDPPPGPSTAPGPPAAALHRGATRGEARGWRPGW